MFPVLKDNFRRYNNLYEHETLTNEEITNLMNYGQLTDPNVETSEEEEKPEDLREYTSTIQELTDEINNRNPFSALKKAKMSNEEKSALEIWKQALDNITPQVEVKSRRIGGATFQVPTEIRPDRKESISMKNLILFARKRGGKTMADKLAAEIMDAFNNQGGAFKRKEDMHRMAEANRAFAHFRF